jgi:DMSO/TMAO reductase YedYZ molybdopterin-dependent catalytic subunit
VSAGLALATTELVGALVSRRRPSVIAALASRLVNVLAGPLKTPAVRTFGTHDKAALLVGIVVVSVLLGALFGTLALRSWRVAVAGFVVFGVIGFVVGRRDPQSSTLALALASASGVIAGVAALHVLLRIGERPQQATETATMNRRTFIMGAGAVAATATVVAVAGRMLRATGRAVASGTLPAPRSIVTVPEAQPFTVDGLSSYVTPADSFYRIDTAVFVPQVDAADWTLTIDGLVERSITYSYAQLLARDLTEEPVTLACVSNDVGGNLLGNARWRGVPLRSLLQEAGVRAEASQIVGHSLDDFTVGFPTSVLDDGRTAMVAFGINGQPLPPAHGFPARLIVAGLYGYVSATKWLKRIELTRLEDYDAYWITRGWAKEGPIKTQSRVDVPRSGASVPAGTVAIAGVAWAPTRGISKVEVQIDDQPWVAARLGVVANVNTWVQWMYQWTDAAPGAHVVGVRATDGGGTLQTDEPRPPAPDGATGYHYRGFTVV